MRAIRPVPSGSISRAVKSSSNQKPWVASPTKAPASPTTTARPKQMMATRESLSVRVAGGAASRLSVEDKVKLLAHVAALERLAQAPDAGIEDEMRHHHAEERAIGGEPPGEVGDVRRQDGRIQREGAQGCHAEQRDHRGDRVAPAETHHAHEHEILQTVRHGVAQGRRYGIAEQ